MNVNIHRVQRIVLQETKTLFTPQGKAIVFRTIKVTHEDGRVTEIDLFADNADAENLMTDKERQQ